MNTLFKLFTIFVSFNATNSQTLLGGSADEHNCYTDGGYKWCESANMCQRPWESPCLDNQQIQCQKCPPPIECPPIPPNCNYTPLKDECGCQTECGMVDCKPIISNEGEVCSGNVPSNIFHQCRDGLECINKMGPYIVDAPGICEPPCPYSRDNWGNCIDYNCNQWFDGCNRCVVSNGDIIQCTNTICYGITESSHCLDEEVTNKDPMVPHNCIMWFDGCNTCSMSDGIPRICTLMMCFTNEEPYCQSFTTDDLIEGDICYRYCEDNSQSTINRREGCPKGTICSPKLGAPVSFDNCGENTYICLPPSTGH